MMSQLREELLEAMGKTYQQFSVAMERGEASRARNALNKLKSLKKSLVSARKQEQFRYLHSENSGQSCMVCRDEDGQSVVVQAWDGCDGCEVTRFRSLKDAKKALLSGGYVAMSMV